MAISGSELDQLLGQDAAPDPSRSNPLQERIPEVCAIRTFPLSILYSQTCRTFLLVNCQEQTGPSTSWGSHGSLSLSAPSKLSGPASDLIRLSGSTSFQGRADEPAFATSLPEALPLLPLGARSWGLLTFYLQKTQ